MSRMKTFFMIFLAVVVVYFGSNLLINISLNNTYKDIKISNNVNETGIVLNINEAKATMINGYIKGNLQNNTNVFLEEKILKIEFYSKRNISLDTKYVKIENLAKGEIANINLEFKVDNVDYAIITIADNEFVNNIGG